MSPTTDPSRLYRFTKEAPGVEFEHDNPNLKMMGITYVGPCNGWVFRVVGKTTHPSQKKPCLLGEIYGGKYDGTLFWTFPGVESDEIWSVITEDVNLP